MEQKSNECLNTSPYLLRRTEGISATEPSRIPSNMHHSRAKGIHVSACRNHVLNDLEVFGVIILEGSKQHRKIQVSEEESHATSASNRSKCEKYAAQYHGSRVWCAHFRIHVCTGGNQQPGDFCIPFIHCSAVVIWLRAC